MRKWNVIFKTIALILGLSVLSSPALAQLRSDFRVFSDSFISPSFEANQKSNYQFVGLGLKSSPYTEEYLKMDIEGAVAVGASMMNYLNISEVYFQTVPSDNEKLFIGRKLLHWNDLDRRWNFGLWQPLFQWNPLSSQQQGLSGLFWQADRQNYAVTIFASPIFIPNQGPTFEVSNGTFVRGNPWFRRPPESVRIFEEVTDVEYNFVRPQETQVVFQASYGAKLSFGNPEEALAQLSYMYKPSNELAIGYSGLLDTSKLRGVVDLKPQVFFHTLSGIDLSHRLGFLRYGVSAVYDRPQKDIEFDSQWTHPEFSDATMVSPFVEVSLGKSTIVALQSLQVYGGQVREVGDMASTDRAPLTTRYPFQQAIKISMDNRFLLKNNSRLTSKLSYTDSEKNDFEYFQWAVNYRFSPVWSGFSELEMVRAGETSAQNQNEIAQYKNLDRFMVGAAYVF